jgi:hypothetical protein
MTLRGFSFSSELALEASGIAQHVASQDFAL